MSVDSASLLHAPKQKIFKGDMALIVSFLLLIIVIERYANRSDTKAINKSLVKTKET